MHLLDCESLNKEWLLRFFKETQKIKNTVILPNCATEELRGYHAGLLFYEPSTRTRASFHIASRFLGAEPVTIEIASSSVQKGESLEDTVMTLEAMGCHFLVIRHNEPGAALKASRCVKYAHVINAGDGTHEHPTQALLDIFTILEKKETLENLTYLFLGDIYHSRVARSNIILLRELGVKRLLVCGPTSLMPEAADLKKLGVSYEPKLSTALEAADVINVLRVQLERHRERLKMSLKEYRASYGLTSERVKKFCKKDVLIMHPGPMNIGAEIDREAADGPNSVVLNQVQNGVAVRAALLRVLHKSCS